mmetsp:Transcript_46387/g.83932  ORF Transcript_46387/g.83932 Transcript_46387/m.83932 type:complete len:983 (+) Transcript_46387:43-2991(+)
MKLSSGNLVLWWAASAVAVQPEHPGHGANNSVQEHHLRLNFLQAQPHSATDSFVEEGWHAWHSWRSWFSSEDSLHSLLARLNAIPPGRQQMYFRPVSTTLQCVMLLTIGSLCVYTSLAISRNVDELAGEFKPSKITQVLTAASRAMALPPMMCMLFVGCRMYVLATTEGLGEPPLWMKICMYASSGALITQYLIVLTLPMYLKGAQEEAAYDMTEGKRAIAAKQAAEALLKGPRKGVEESAEVVTVEEIDIPTFNDQVGDYHDAHPSLRKIEFHDEENSSIYYGIFFTLQIVLMLSLYGGLAGVIIGIFTFPRGSTEMSAAVLCTVILSVLYFWSYSILWIGRSWYDCNFQRILLNSALSMKWATRKVPQFSVLFLVSRMRALQLDPPYGMPPPWMQMCFFTVTGCIFVEAFAAAFIGAFGTYKKGYYGVYVYQCKYHAVHVVRHLFAMITYLALFPIAVGVYMMKDQYGNPAPLSTTMNCTLLFTAIYFTIAFGQTTTFFCEETFGLDMPVLQDTFIAAGIGMSFVPLLCILFVATRMRALQITQQQGDPPGWAQDCMLICVFATCVQALCCLVMPIFIGAAVKGKKEDTQADGTEKPAFKVDDDGNPDYDLRPMIGAYAVTVTKFVAMFSLHGGVIAICVANFVMTPETANSGDRFIKGGKQFFEGIAITLLVLCMSLLFSSAKVVGLAVKFAIESCDEVFLGVNITIRQAALSVCKGYVNIRDLKVHQPEKETIYEKQADGKVVKTVLDKPLNWKYDYVLKAKTVLVKINMWRLIRTLGKEFELENLNISGIHANVEKPTCDTKAKDSNVEYIVQHIESLGLIPPPEAAAAEALKADKDKAAAAPAPADDFQPKVILHKIVLGDFGCGVRVLGVPALGSIEFHPTIGVLAFDDIQNTIFDGKEDLNSSEVVACVTKAIAKKLSAKVTKDIPKELARLTTAGAKAIIKRGLSCGSGVASGFKRATSSKDPAAVRSASQTL